MSGSKKVKESELRKALYLHVPQTLLDRLDDFVDDYSREIGVRVSRADVVRMILESHLNRREKSASADVITG